MKDKVWCNGIYFAGKPRFTGIILIKDTQRIRLPSK